jgi:hypothetical protein
MLRAMSQRCRLLSRRLFARQQAVIASTSPPRRALESASALTLAGNRSRETSSENEAADAQTEN